MRQAICIATGLLLIGAAWATTWRTGVAPGQPAIDRQAPVAEATPPSRAVSDPVDAISAPAEPDATTIMGVVAPVAQATVCARDAGVLREFSRRLGQCVEAGEALAVLDDAELVIQAQRQKARIESTRARIAAAQATLHQAQAKLEQIAPLRATNSTSAFEEIDTRWQVETANANLKALEGDLKEQQIELQRVDCLLQKTRCIAPITGQLVEITHMAGEYVRDGEIIARISSSRHVLAANLPSSLAGDAASLSFTWCTGENSIDLHIVDVSPWCNPGGSRGITLTLPEDCGLVAGQIVHITVRSRP